MAAKPAGAAAGSALDRLPPIAKVGIGLVLLVLFGALYFVIFFSDVSSEIASSKQKHQQLTTKLAEAKSSQEAYQKDSDEKTRRELLAREQKKILPDDAETPTFLAGLQGVATVSGVNLTSWSPTEESTAEFYAKVPMKLTLSGKFHQVAKFFFGVGQVDRIINVENIHIKAGKAQGDEVAVDVECLATAFRATRAGESAAPAKRRGTGK